MKALKRCYHHGDLRNALIVAAAELIEESDSLGFSITDAAKRAGVSSAAPYRHFKDKEELLLAVRDLAFIGLNNQMIEVSKTTERGSVEQIIALGHAYVGYAQEKHAFFGLMWEARGDIEEQRAEATMKAQGFHVLTNAIKDCVENGLLPASTVPTAFATQMWAMVHGVATLETNHMLDVFDASAAGQRMIAEGTRALFRGLRPS